MTHYEIKHFPILQVKEHDVIFCPKDLFIKYLPVGTRLSIWKDSFYPNYVGEYIIRKHYYKHSHWWKTKRSLWMGSDIEYIGNYKGIEL